MIVKFRIVRKDTQAAIPGAKIVLEHGETDGITNSAGEAEIVIFWSGNMMFSVTATGYDKASGTVQVPTSGSITRGVELGAYVQPPVPPAEGETIEGRIGTSCSIVKKYMFNQNWYGVRHDRQGSVSGWEDTFQESVENAEKYNPCFETPPPPPETVEDVQKDVDILRGTLQGLGSRVQDLVTSITEMGKALVDLEARIKAWITESILDLIWSALTRENKVG